MLIKCFKWSLGLIVRLLFRVEVHGMENYYAAGKRVLVVSNHTSLLDAMFLYLFIPDQLTFAINRRIASHWYFKPFFYLSDIFEMETGNALSTKSLIKYLREDNKAVIFPEGRITVTGGLMKIYDGPGVVADKAEAAVLPVAIEGAQFSKQSYRNKDIRTLAFPKIRITVLPAQYLDLPDDCQGRERRAAAAEFMTRIMHSIMMANSETDTTLFKAMLHSAEYHGYDQKIAEDIERAPVNYRQLLTRAFILGRLISKRTRRGEFVGLMLPNMVTTLITFIAMQAFGRIPAMLNFTAGPQGLANACDTAQIKTVFTSRRFIETAELESSVEALQEKVKVVFLEDLRSEVGLAAKFKGLLAAYFPHSFHHRTYKQMSAEDTAVVLFTSGSEGLPKGVALSHFNLLSNRAQIRTHLDLSTRDTVLNALPVFHCFGLTGGTILPLLEGCPIFFYPTPLHYKIIPELCYELGATLLFGTNTFLAGYARHAHPFDFRSMRYVVAGAEKLQEDTQKLWMEKFGIRVLQGYGMTEGSPVVAVNTPMKHKSGTVGRFVPGIDHYLEPVEGIAEGGRLFISGPNIMKGYLFHGDAGRLIAPHSDRGPGWYDTGDIATVDADGFVRITGRAKRFAKIGGEMVSLTAVEELASLTWPNNTSAALTTTDPRKGEQIILFTDQPDADRKQLVETAKKNGVNELCLPRQVRVLQSIPLTGTGKIDYQCLMAAISASD